MKSEIRKTLIQKLNDALFAEVPELTRREIRLPAVPGKAIAVIGMRRSGKTCFLSQCMADLPTAIRTAVSGFDSRVEVFVGRGKGQLNCGNTRGVWIP